MGNGWPWDRSTSAAEGMLGNSHFLIREVQAHNGADHVRPVSHEPPCSCGGHSTTRQSAGTRLTYVTAVDRFQTTRYYLLLEGKKVLMFWNISLYTLLLHIATTARCGSVIPSQSTAASDFQSWNSFIRPTLSAQVSLRRFRTMTKLVHTALCSFSFSRRLHL